MQLLYKCQHLLNYNQVFVLIYIFLKKILFFIKSIYTVKVAFVKSEPEHLHVHGTVQFTQLSLVAYITTYRNEYQ